MGHSGSRSGAFLVLFLFFLPFFPSFSLFRSELRDRNRLRRDVVVSFDLGLFSTMIPIGACYRQYDKRKGRYVSILNLIGINEYVWI